MHCFLGMSLGGSGSFAKNTNGGTINNSYALGYINSTSSDVGGLVGQAQGDISNSYFIGNISFQF